MAYTSLNQISAEKDTWNVKVRIIRMWDAVNIANDHELISLDMIMADENVSCIHFFFSQLLYKNKIIIDMEMLHFRQFKFLNFIFQGTLIHASIRKNFAQRFRPLFNEGCVYEIKNFIVEEYKVKYRPVHNQVKILFMSTTSVSKIHGIDHSIPQYGFELADYKTIIESLQ
jgi:hypothetical protein